jgi:hypothetical protein
VPDPFLSLPGAPIAALVACADRLYGIARHLIPPVSGKRSSMLGATQVIDANGTLANN